MKIIVATMSHWDDQRNADVWKGSLNLMLSCCRRFVPPYETIRPIITCGTWSEPSLCPIAAEVINCQCTRNEHNVQAPDGLWHSDEMYNCLTFPAFNGALWYALLAKWPWDLLMWIYHKNTLIGQDLGPVLEQFMAHKEILMAPSIWRKWPDLSLSFWKKEAVVKYLNCRYRPNLIRFPDVPKECHMLFENEVGLIFRDDWWNPWPEITNFRMDGHIERFGTNNPNPITKEEVLMWPGVTGMPEVWLADYLAAKGLSV